MITPSEIAQLACRPAQVRPREFSELPSTISPRVTHEDTTRRADIDYAALRFRVVVLMLPSGNFVGTLTVYAKIDCLSEQSRRDTRLRAR